MDPSDLSARLRDACGEAFADEPVVAAYLHGSAVSGRTGPFSDVDVALLLEEPCRDPLGESLRLGGVLADRARIPDLDVRVLNGTELGFQGRVVQDGAVVYGDDSPTRVAFEVRTLKRFLDFEIHARERRQAFLARVARGSG